MHPADDGYIGRRMAALDEITQALKDLYQKLSVTGRRTAAVTRLRLELAGLDKERKEAFSRLGERVSELKRTGQIRDAGFLGLLESEFERIDRVRKKMQDTMDSIREINLQEMEAATTDELSFELDDKAVGKSENLLDSFEVL